MNDHHWLVEQFEAHRNHLQAVAYRILGSLSEADDAVQESWIRLSRTDTNKEDGSDPEHEALMADSVGLAMLVVLGKLNPAERIAFVLHDIFALSFSEIASIIGRNEAAARKLASRARRRVKGTESASGTEELQRKRELVDAFLAASRSGDFEKLLTVLDPNVVLRNDTAFAPVANSPVVRGSQAVAKQFAGRAQGARPVLVNGSVGVVVAPFGRPLFVLELTVADGKITEIDMTADQARLRQLDIAVLND